VRVVVIVAPLLFACSFDHGVAGTDGDGGGASPDGSDASSSSHVTSPRKLVLDNSASASDFGPHPVLVALDATKIDYSVVANPQTDLRFEWAQATPAAPLGDNVPFEIDTWNPGGESIVWIRVPEILHGTTNTAVLMHFGPSAAGAANATAVWTNWELVNHMKTGLASSIGTYTATGVGVTSAPGPFGEATAFSGTGDQRVTFANSGALLDGWNQFYISFWIYPDYNNAASDLVGQPLVLDKGGSIALGRLYANAGNIMFQIDEHFTGSANDVSLTTTLPAKTWTYVALQFDGTVTWIAKNGALAQMVDLNGDMQALVGSTQPVRLGDASNAFRGRIDELRVEHRSRRLDYARAQYLIGARQFVTFTDP
jgi:hypothetical protein